jgi:hypothetical protein
MLPCTHNPHECYNCGNIPLHLVLPILKSNNCILAIQQHRKNSLSEKALGNKNADIGVRLQDTSLRAAGPAEAHGFGCQRVSPTRSPRSTSRIRH